MECGLQPAGFKCARNDDALKGALRTGESTLAVLGLELVGEFLGESGRFATSDLDEHEALAGAGADGLAEAYFGFEGEGRAADFAAPHAAEGLVKELEGFVVDDVGGMEHGEHVFGDHALGRVVDAEHFVAQIFEPAYVDAVVDVPVHVDVVGAYEERFFNE
jgi:hypothetical protein